MYVGPEMPEQSGKVHTAVASKPWGFVSGIASPCCFYHEAMGLACVVHGDNCTCLGLDAEIDLYEKQLAYNFELKIRGRLGKGCSNPNEIGILNRIVRIEDDALYYKADPWHIDLVAESLNIASANSVGAPGMKNKDPSTEPNDKAADAPDDTIDNDSDDLKSLIGNCGWADARNLPELGWRTAPPNSDRFTGMVRPIMTARRETLCFVKHCEKVSKYPETGAPRFVHLGHQNTVVERRVPQSHHPLQDVAKFHWLTAPQP